MNFPSINSKVIKQTTNAAKEYNDFQKSSTSFMVNEALKNKVVTEQTVEVQKNETKNEKENKFKQINEKIYQKGILESQLLNMQNVLYNQGKEILYKDILFELYRKSLNLDEDFINEQLENIKSVSDSYIDKNGGFKYLAEKAKSTGSPILEQFQGVCENTAYRVSQRKYQLALEALKNDKEISKEEIDKIFAFSMDNDEKEEFDYSKDEISIDELSDLVKQKVLDVVQDEKSRQAKEDEIIEDIENQLIDDESVVDQKSLNEALRKIELPLSAVEESTLFDSLMRNSYQEILESNASIQDSSLSEDLDNEKDIRTDSNINVDNDDATCNSFNETKSIHYSLTDEINKTDRKSVV